MSESDEVLAAVAAMWTRNRGRLLERLARVRQAVDDVAAGHSCSEEGERDAHVLAGALGTYGRPGSGLLRRAELLLAGGVEADMAGLRKELRELASTLER